MKIKNIWYEFEEWADGYDEYDENSDVIFEISDSTKWCASFFTYRNLLSLSKKNQITGEYLSGKYFLADKPIFISEMKKDIILSVLNDIIRTETDLSDVFTRVD
ncbi:MAG: hypothetical protein K2J40_06460 [Ruminococcus sp.]|nr:hypothetical protein [Ruminococcus sp.]